ncbi:hypothetical protein, conserved in T. vivax [Trypanosoma vivax Y486]|uniref:65 kDa invariant surface glycoprotein n=1 Tax=Trypanosoma vivax (strain Y486) TaxID=1055687 RepID=F9WNA6_TRYVY|nr:hypothetical protein, conserved in T. vivax [Trypanosoma vivax Y486]|eukprot:CCD19022.1 hypothetical protein, conserved in T. vivax [Trypanosoma vivax Y486]
MTRQHLLPLLACALLCGGVLASSSASSLATTSLTSDVPNETLCEWWRNKARVRRRAVVLQSHLLQKRDNLTTKYQRFVNKVGDAGAAAQHSAVDKAWNEIRTKYWEGFLLASEGSGKASAIAAHMTLWQRYLPPRWKRFSQNLSCNLVPHMADRNIALLHDGLAKDVKELFNLCKQHNIEHCDFYERKTDPQISWLNKTKTFDAVEAKLDELYRSAEEALKKAQMEKNVFDEKVFIGCELEKKLDIVRDTFLGLKKIAEDVTAMEAGLAKIADELQVKAKSLGMSDVAVADTQHVRHMANEVVENISPALQRILAAMYGSTNSSLHALLNYGKEFKHDFSNCRSEMVERTVLLRLVNEERQHHFDDFEEWRKATEVMWTSVTNMTLPHNANCSTWGAVGCEALLNAANDLFEASRSSRKDAEAKLDEMIKGTLMIEGQVKEGMVRLAAKEEEQKRLKQAHTTTQNKQAELQKADTPVVYEHPSHADKQAGSEADAATAAGVKGAESNTMTSVVDQMLQDLAEGAHSDASAPQAEEVDRKLRELEDVMIGVVPGEEDDELLEAEAGDVGGVSGSKRPSTIVLAVVVPIVVATLAAAGLFVFSRRRRVVKDVASA